MSKLYREMTESRDAMSNEPFVFEGNEAITGVLISKRKAIF